MLASGAHSGPPLVPVTPEQVHVMLGPLVAAARGLGAGHSLPTTDLSRAASHAPANTTSPLDGQQAAASSGRHQDDNSVNALSPYSFAPPTLNSTAHQLVQNLLLHARAPDYDGSTATNLDHNRHHLQHNLTQFGQLDQPTSGRGPFSSCEWLMIVALVTIILISIVGNLLVCVAIFTDRRLRKLGNAFIVSLAIADLFVSFLVMTFALHNDLMEEWIFGAWFCDIWISFDIMCCTASILNLCAISLDRFIHIKDCLLYNQLMTRRVAISAVIMIWITSGLVSFVPITLGWHKPSSVMPPPDTSLPAVARQVHLAGEGLARATTQLPVGLADGGSVGGSLVALGDRQIPAAAGGDGGGRERAKRAAAAAYAIKHGQSARKLNYSEASGDDAGRRRPNEPIGSADTSSLRRRRHGRRLNTTRAAGGGESDQSGRPERRPDDKEDKHGIGMRANEMRQFDQAASRVAGAAAQVAASEDAPKEEKSNLGDGKPRAPPPPTEQIKHLPRARRRRQLGGVAGVASKLADRDDEEEDEPSSGGGGRFEQEQTKQRAHSQPEQPSHWNGPREMGSDREQDDEPPPPPPPRAQQPALAPAQCMLTLTPTYAVISSTISFYIPCIIMLGLYSKLFACARRHVRNIKAISKAPQPIGGGGWANSTNALASTGNYVGVGSAAAAAASNNNHISTSSGTSNLTSRGPVGPVLDRARRLIGAGNQRKACITETTCAPDASDKRSARPGGKLARLVGARARTWIKLRAGETADRNSIAPGGQSRKNSRQRESVSASSAEGQPQPPGGRLVLKSILSNQKRPQQQQLEQSLPATDQPRPPGHGAEDNTVTHSSVSANAELEPFLASAGGERKSVASTNALGVKLNMIGAGAAVGADSAAAAAANLQMHRNQNQNQNQQRQLNARLQHQQQQPPPPPLLQPTKQQTSQLATHKAAITLGIIMGTFLLCWLPFFCLNIIKAFYADLIPAWLFRAFTWLGYANSALNPIIYGIHNSEFRNAFNRIFFKHLTLKNGRQYLNRRFSYDLRQHHNSPAAAGAQARRRGNYNEANNNNNNNSQQSGSAVVAPLLAAGAHKNSAAQSNQLVGLARGESHAQLNRPNQLAQQRAASNNLHGDATTSVKHNRTRAQDRAGSLAMSSSRDPNQQQQQQCLNLLNCLQERAGGHTSTAPSASNTTVHRTSEDLSGVKVVAQVAATAEEQPEPQQQVHAQQTVALG